MIMEEGATVIEEREDPIQFVFNFKFILRLDMMQFIEITIMSNLVTNKHYKKNEFYLQILSFTLMN